MKFWNCSKTLIEDLADYSATYSGFDAKYFEDCSESNDELITIYEKEYREAKIEEFYGSTDANSTKWCTSILGSSSAVGPNASVEKDPAMLMLKMAYKTFFSWYRLANPEIFV